MKNLQRVFAKVDVLGCEEKMDRDGKRMTTKDGTALFSVDVEEFSFSEKYNKKMNNIVTYKSLQAVSIGEQILELKVSNIGEGSGDFVGVKTFFTIMRQVPKNSSIDEVLDRKSVV